MRLRHVAVRLSLALVVALGGPASLADNSNKIVTLTSDPWPPYILGELGSEATGGIGVDLLNLIFARLDDTDIDIPLLPWNRALREVQLGTKDGIGILVKTVAREAYMVYTDELFRSYNSIWYLADRFPDGVDWQDYSDLAPYKLGVIGGHSYGPEFDQIVADGYVGIIEVPSADHLFAMLAKGRLDLAIANQLVGQSYVARFADEDKRLEEAANLGAADIFYIAFSRKSAARHLIPEINRIVSELRDEGLIQKLIGAGSRDSIETSMPAQRTGDN